MLDAAGCVLADISLLSETVSFVRASLVRQVVAVPCPAGFEVSATPATVNLGSSKNSSCAGEGLCAAGVCDLGELAVG
jgi:hypothetical protein